MRTFYTEQNDENCVVRMTRMIDSHAGENDENGMVILARLVRMTKMMIAMLVRMTRMIW